jgi:hypothetical protein
LPSCGDKLKMSHKNGRNGFYFPMMINDLAKWNKVKEQIKVYMCIVNINVAPEMERNVSIDCTAHLKPRKVLMRKKKQNQHLRITVYCKY